MVKKKLIRGVWVFCSLKPSIDRCDDGKPLVYRRGHFHFSGSGPWNTFGVPYLFIYIKREVYRAEKEHPIH